MKTKRVEFHTWRYPANLPKTPLLSPDKVGKLYAEVDCRRNSQTRDEFLRWCAENNALIDSPLFRTFCAARHRRESEKRTLFYELRSISERYTVSLALLGGYLCFLNRSRNECEDAALLAQTFLTEIAIYDSIFASAHARELQSYEYLDWIDRHPRFEPLIDDYDEAFALNAAWVKKEDADDQVNEAKLRVEHQKLPSEYLSLILEEEVRLSQPNHDLEYDFHRSWIIQKHIAGAMQPDLHPPVSIEGIMKILKKWDDAGRHLGWQSLVIQRCQELERLDKLIAHVDEADPVEDDDFAETLWNQGEQFWRTSDW